MILVLTYHKVLSAVDRQSDFYSVLASQLEYHIDVLRNNEFSILSPLELLGGQPQVNRTCVLTFDDGTIDHFELVKPILEERNCRGLFFVPTSKLNKPGRLSSEQVRRLSESGHAIGSHSHEHTRLDILPEEDVRAQIEVARQNIQQIIGKPPVFFAPPGGFTNPVVRRVAEESQVKVIRTMRWGYNKAPDFLDLSCVPINRFFTETEFSQIVEGRNLQFKYRAKQIAKSLIPARMYEPIRAFFFDAARRN